MWWIRSGAIRSLPEDISFQIVNLYFNSFIVYMEIPAGGSPLDKRLVPESTANGFFYGQPWTSAEGKAMAARLPRKGNPYPVFSNLVK